MTGYRTAEYERRLKSADWARLRERVMASQWGRCGRCAQRDVPLELHHRHYRTLGAERPEDVVALCQPCHAEADRLRASQGRARASAALWSARVDGWAEAVGFEGSPHDAELAFIDWLDRRGEGVWP